MTINCPQARFKATFMTHLFTLRRKPHTMTEALESSVPPTPPPKDIVVAHHKVSFHTYPQQTYSKPLPIPQQHEYINEKPLGVSEYYVVPETQPQTTLLLASSPPRSVPRPPRKSNPDGSPVVLLTPEERAKRRLAAQRKREREEEEALREEQDRRALKQRQREEQERQEREEEARRKALLAEHLRQAAARKAKEERDARECEERRLREVQERKRIDHEKRLQYTRKLEKWRFEQIQRAASQSSEKEEELRRSAEERRIRIARISDQVLQDGSNTAMCGWVTIQTPELLAWKRRYFKFDLTRSQLTLYRNQLDTSRAMDVVNMDGRVDSLNEWYEGFEELEAIPHSFALRFVDRQSWLMYADTAEEKDKLLVLLSEAGGIIL
ncbi:hypothetical protein F5I97DRAFT_242708 [Phlebopus sp. FC_14]|nr:hypothetical protein F5I97DRAFT_242708 [Phlebopus sp. FC_14]